MTEGSFCPVCRRPVFSGDLVCFHCRAVLDPFTRGARIADRYVIEESIGQGGMGRVYSAYDEVLDEKVAIKTLLAGFAANPTFVTRFREEVRLARRVAHPNVCRVHDYVGHEGIPFFSMEWVEGETLAARLKRLGACPEAELHVALREVTEALRALWSNGIVHRDLKPANLMWTRASQIKVMDFGLARALLGEGGRDRTSGVIGSPEYLSPEQIRGEPATEKSDTYALGVTLFELASGHPPFKGASPAQTLMKHLSDPPDASVLGSLSEGLRSMILRSLDKNPAARPDLRLPEDDRVRPDSKGLGGGEARRPRVVPWVASLAGLAGVIAVATYLDFWPPPQPDASSPPAASSLSSPDRLATPVLRGESTAAATSALGSNHAPPTGAPRVNAKPSAVSAATLPPGLPDEGMGTMEPESGAPLKPTPDPTPPEGPTPELKAAVTGSMAPVPEPTPLKSPATPVDTKLVVVVSPWAEVFVDGDRKGLTPLPALVLPSGSHVVELRHPDFRPFFRTIEIKDGEQFRLSVNLRLEAIRR